MSDLPRHVTDFDKHRPRFEAWLAERGSALLKPTNHYEIARFLTDIGVGVIYCKDGGRLTTWTNGADQAFRAFRRGEQWRAVAKGQRGNVKKRNLFATLARRDGTGCLYCGAGLTVESATIEHVLSVTHGGTSHPANLALACSDCNKQASHLTVREKIEIAIRRRAP